MPLLVMIGLILVAIGLLLTPKIVKDPDWGILAIFFLLPFERIPTVEVAGFTLKLNHIVGSMVIVLWLVRLLKSQPSAENSQLQTPEFSLGGKLQRGESEAEERNSQQILHPTNIFIWLFIVALVLSFTRAVDPIRSVIFFAQALFVFGLYAVVANQVNKVEMVEKVIKVIFASTWLVVLFAVYQFVGDYLGLPTGLDQGYTHKVLSFPRVQAFAKEPLYLANWLFLPLGLMIGYMVQSKKPLPKHILILMPLAVLVLILTVSRGAYLGLLAFGLFLMISFGQKLVRSQAFIKAALVMIGAVIALIVLLVSLGPNIADRFIAQATARDIELSSESIFGRLRAFGQAIDVWQSSPLTGVGLGGFGPALDQTISTGYPIVNNQYLETLSETGLIGLVAFAAIMASLLIVFLKIRLRLIGDWSAEFLPATLVGLSAALIATLVQYNFFSTLAIIHIWVLIGLIVAVESILLKKLAKIRL